MPAVGLLGGAFDPVHKGHTTLARVAMQRCGLAEVVFIPSASPPHKSGRTITSFHHRLEMLRLATAGESRFKISEVEWYIPPPTYTIDMLSYLPDEENIGGEYHFIIGSDAFLELPTWKAYTRLLQRVHFIVVHRQGYEADDIDVYIQSLGYSQQGDHWRNTLSGKKIYYIEAKIPDVSSTQIRRTIGTEEFPKDCLSPRVYAYVQEHGLYGACSKS